MRKTKLLSSLVLVFAIICAIVISLCVKTYAVSTVIELDVNPSLKINLSSNDKVISVEALNEDAKKVVGDMEFKGSDVEITVNALIGSMMQNGYLTTDTNQVLINIQSEDKEKEDLLNKSISSNIENALSSNGVSGVVLNNQIQETSKTEVSIIATENEISNGKANLINEIILLNPDYKIEELANLSITELNSILENKNNISVNTQYITAEKALEIAKNHAGITNSEFEKTKFDIENNIEIFEVEFTSELIEYDYDINALTGDIIHFEREAKDLDDIIEDAIKTPAPAPTQSPENITADKALEIAKNHAGASEINLVKNELDIDDGIKHYEIEFYSNNTKYEFDILAKDGSILSYEKDINDDDLNDDFPSQSQVSTEIITANSALEIAKTHAGVNSVFDIENELDNDDGIKVYEIEFKTNLCEYEYEINALTGAIISYDKDFND